MKIPFGIILSLCLVFQSIYGMKIESPLLSATEYHDTEKNIRVLLYGFSAVKEKFDPAYAQAIQLKIAQSSTIKFFIHGGPHKQKHPKCYTAAQEKFLVSLYDTLQGSCQLDKHHVVYNLDDEKEWFFDLLEAYVNEDNDNKISILPNTLALSLPKLCEKYLENLTNKLEKRYEGFVNFAWSQAKECCEIAEQYELCDVLLGAWPTIDKEKQCLRALKDKLLVLLKYMDELTVFEAIINSQSNSTIVLFSNRDNEESLCYIGHWLCLLGYSYVNFSGITPEKSLPCALFDWIDVPQKACSVCFKNNALKRCGDCKMRYCSIDCQKRDWKHHKTYCEKQDSATFNDIMNATTEQLEELGLSEKQQNILRQLFNK